MSEQIKELARKFLNGELESEQLKMMNNLIKSATKHHNDSLSYLSFGFDILRYIKQSSCFTRYEIEKEVERRITLKVDGDIIKYWAPSLTSQSFIDEIVADAKSHDFKSYIELLKFAQSVQFKYVFDNLWDGLEKIVENTLTK